MYRTQLRPRYTALAETIRQAINAGDFLPGDRLPSEAELCRSNGVSRGTVVKAIEQLVSEGFVHRKQGSGSFVANRSLHRRAGGLLSFSETARADGHRTEQRVLSFGPAPEKLAREFSCDPPAVSLLRLRLIDGMACALHRSVIPVSVSRAMPMLSNPESAVLNDPAFSLYDSFEKCGFPIEEAQERVTTRLAGEEEAEHLGLSLPAAIMVVFRKSYTPSGQLIEAVEAAYRSDFYTYDMHLVRGHPHRTMGSALHTD